MIKICFVCLGNICRSPMAEFVMKKLVAQKQLENFFYIESRATSNSEIGNGIYENTIEKLKQHNISFDENKTATQIQKQDFEKYDYIIGMDDSNILNLKRIFNQNDPKKIKKLLDFTNNPRDIADPWYTRDFDKAYEDILEGCQCFLEFLIKKHNL